MMKSDRILNNMRLIAALFLTVILCASELRAQDARKRYPYVTTNEEGRRTVIVCRENGHGVRESIINPNRQTTTTIHFYYEREKLKLPARFEVWTPATNRNKVSASKVTTYCSEEAGEGWYVPNIRVMCLISALYNELEPGLLISDEMIESIMSPLWSSTQANNNELRKYYVYITPGSGPQPAYSSSSSPYAYILCIRDL